MEENNRIIHGLWIGDKLSAIEILCIQSYLKNGHTFYLWAYSKIQNLPIGTQIKDANKIIPYNEIFTYTNTNKFGHGKGSYAGFSDIFRYKLLYEFGGWWTDMDITCLKQLDFDDSYVFRKNGDKGVVGNLIKCPAKSDLMHYCYTKAKNEVSSSNKNWMLPINILNEGIKKYHLQYTILNITNEDSWALVSNFLITDFYIPDNWVAIHWMNEEWRRLTIKKDSFLKDSLIEKLLIKFEVEHKILSEKEIKKLVWNIGIWNYRIVNLKARIKWYLNL